jgi:hypothetical protein
MSQLIQEAKRLQELAGISTNNKSIPAADTNQEDTSDEKRLGRIVASISTLIAALGGIDNPMELDGLFREILKHTKLKEIPKTVVMQKLKATLDQTAPNSSTITTKSATDKTT